jgi:cell wall-associated NlpC family hydrolase
MKWSILILSIFTVYSLYACIWVTDKKQDVKISSTDSSAAYGSTDTIVQIDSLPKDSVVAEFFKGKEINTKNVQPQQVVQYARSLIGTPYRYASTDPGKGFDCSGFITYVFNHFNIIVPRSSIDFTNVGRAVPPDSARAGDLILFTGTDSTERFVGHMGLVVSNESGQLNFIHSSSGKSYGVIITPLNGYYRGRYMKTIRVFPASFMK